MNDQMKALAGDWHDMNEAGCCDALTETEDFDE